MVTAAMKLKDALLLGRKVMTNLDSIFKSRDITLPTKVHLVKAMVSPVDLPGPRIEPMSPTLQADSLLSEPPGKLKICLLVHKYIYYLA